MRWSLSAPPVMRSADNRPGQHDRRGALDVVVEGADAVAVALQQAERIGVGEILELDQRAGEHLLHRRDEFLDQRVVARAAQALLPQPDVERVVAQGLVVGADVEHHRQAAPRMHAGAPGIERELADRDAHAVRAQVAQAEDALAVGDHDDADVALRPVAQHLRDLAAVVGADEQAARPLEDVAELLAGEADGRRVDERHDLVGMLGDDAEEQRLVAVVQRVQVDELLERARQAAQVREAALHLLVLGMHVRRQQPAQAEPGALLLRERGALVEQRVAQHRHAAAPGSQSVFHISSGTILIAPQGHSAAHMPQPLQ